MLLSVFFCVLLFIMLWPFSYFFFSNTASLKKQTVIRCVINYLHTLVLFSNYNQSGGVYLDSYVIGVNRLSLAIKFWFSLDCYEKFLLPSNSFSIKYLLELVYFHLFLIVFLYLRYRKNKSSRVKNLKEAILEEALFLWYLFYPSVLHHLVNNSFCIKINDEYHLFSEPNYKCSANDIKMTIGINITLMIIWLLVGPLKIIMNLQKIQSYMLSDRKTKNIFLINYKKKVFIIEIKQYIYKCAMFAINASSLRGDYKVLLLWLVFFYSVKNETGTRNMIVSRIQLIGQILITINYLLIAYAIMWFIFYSSPTAGITMFASSLFVQMFFIIIMIYSYFEKPMPRFLQNFINLATPKIFEITCEEKPKSPKQFIGFIQKGVSHSTERFKLEEKSKEAGLVDSIIIPEENLDQNSQNIQLASLKIPTKFRSISYLSERSSSKKLHNSSLDQIDIEESSEVIFPDNIKSKKK